MELKHTILKTARTLGYQTTYIEHRIETQTHLEQLEHDVVEMRWHRHDVDRRALQRSSIDLINYLINTLHFWSLYARSHSEKYAIKSY